MKKAAIIAAFLVGIGFANYIERQSALVRSRRPMKVGTKTVRASSVAVIARYMA